MRFLPNTIGIAIGLLLLAGQAVAQDQDPPEITSQFGLNTFQPASSPADGFAMEHAEVLDSLQFGVQALIQIDDDPLTWKKKNPTEPTREPRLPPNGSSCFISTRSWGS